MRGSCVPRARRSHDHRRLKDTFKSPTSPEDRPGYTYPDGFPPYQTNKIPTRFKNQTFAYDVRGNQTSSTDDLNDFWDRSLGTQQYSVDNYYTKGPDQLEYASETPADPNNTSKLLKANDQSGNTDYTFFSTPTTYNGGTYQYFYDEVNRLSWAEEMQPEWFANDADGTPVVSVHQLEAGYTVYVFDSLVLHDASFSNGTYEDDQATEQVYVAGGLAHVFYDFANALPKVNGSQTHAFISLDDGRGSVGVVIDRDSSEVVERIAYQPYGAYDADYRPARWNYTYERLKFGWHWDNQEIGLINMGARYYSPRLRTFMTPDPLTVHGAAGDLNPYAYAYGNPIRYTDPTGLEGEEVMPMLYFYEGAQVAQVAAQGAEAAAQIASVAAAVAVAVVAVASPQIPTPRATPSDGSWLQQRWDNSIGKENAQKAWNWLKAPFAPGHGLSSWDAFRERIPQILDTANAVGAVCAAVAMVCEGPPILPPGLALAGGGEVPMTAAAPAEAPALLSGGGGEDEGGGYGRPGREGRSPGANRADSKMVSDAARQAGINDRAGFGKFIHETKGAMGRGGSETSPGMSCCSLLRNSRAGADDELRRHL
jgi:RHS repeat-associated protein